MTDEIKTEDVMETFDKLDESLVIAELKGNFLQEYVYSYIDKGKQVTGLSLVGVRETVREMNKRGLTRIAITDKPPIKYETDDYIEIWTYAKDELNGGGNWGIKRQSKFIYRKDSSTSNNVFAMEQALSKSQRNAQRGLIPEHAVKEMIAEYIKSGYVRKVGEKDVGNMLSGKQSKSKNSTDYDRSKEDPNAKPKTKINPKTGKSYCPKVARLHVLATKDYGLNDDEYKKLCIRVTGKEHSKDYINQDCWNIEDEMIKQAVKEAEEILEPELQQEFEESLDK